MVADAKAVDTAEDSSPEPDDEFNRLRAGVGCRYRSRRPLPREWVSPVATASASMVAGGLFIWPLWRILATCAC
jgi:hypothetical protein